MNGWGKIECLVSRIAMKVIVPRIWMYTYIYTYTFACTYVVLTQEGNKTFHVQQINFLY